MTINITPSAAFSWWHYWGPTLVGMMVSSFIPVALIQFIKFRGEKKQRIDDRHNFYLILCDQLYYLHRELTLREFNFDFYAMSKTALKIPLVNKYDLDKYFYATKFNLKQTVLGLNSEVWSINDYIYAYDNHIIVQDNYLKELEIRKHRPRLQYQIEKDQAKAEDISKHANRLEKDIVALCKNLGFTVRKLCDEISLHDGNNIGLDLKTKYKQMGENYGHHGLFNSETYNNTST